MWRETKVNLLVLPLDPTAPLRLSVAPLIIQVPEALDSLCPAWLVAVEDTWQLKTPDLRLPDPLPTTFCR